MEAEGEGEPAQTGLRGKWLIEQSWWGIVG